MKGPAPKGNIKKLNAGIMCHWLSKRYNIYMFQKTNEQSSIAVQREWRYFITIPEEKETRRDVFDRLKTSKWGKLNMSQSNP